MAADCDHDRFGGLHHQRRDVFQVVPGVGDHGHAVFTVAHADQHRPWGQQHRQRSGQRRRVLKMNTYTKITKLVLPSALPLIFTGLRLSLGVGWMVLIAAEMLAQNPGLGKFVWDEFQNGSSQSLARIMVAVFTIGIIGFMLDRVMYALQSMFTFSNNR